MCTMHVFWPKRPMNQKKLDQQSRQQALRAYCPNIYIHILWIQGTLENEPREPKSGHIGTASSEKVWFSICKHLCNLCTIVGPIFCSLHSANIQKRTNTVPSSFGIRVGACIEFHFIANLCTFYYCHPYVTHVSSLTLEFRLKELDLFMSENLSSQL